MPTQESFEDVQQPRRLALFAGVFVAGIIGGVAVTSSLAEAPHARPLAQAGTVSQPVVAVSADPSVPDAAAVLSHRRHERPEAVAPTF